MSIALKEHQRLMNVVRILDKHFGGLISIARRQMLNAQHRGKIDEARKYRDILRELRDYYEEAIDVVADKIMDPKNLKDTKQELRNAADTCFAFLQELKETKAELKKLEKVADYVKDLIATLRAI